jgi:hypothetical protein
VSGAGSTQRAIERLLSEVSGDSVAISTWERIEPWHVYRAGLARGTSVIVKSLREHPTGFRTDPAQVATERAALEFMADHVPGRAPQLIASDLDAGALVLEDLAPRVALWDLLRSGAEGADEGLAAFAHALGDTAARTRGLSDEYNRRRAQLGAFDPLASRTFGGWGWDDARRACDAIGAPPSASAERNVLTAFDVLREPGPFLAFSNGDAGANNYLVDGSDGRMIDWEFAGYRHAVRDAVCLYVPGSVWMTVGDPIAEGHEDVYRTALCAGVSAAAEDAAFALGLASACVGFAVVERLSRLPRVDVRPSGHESHVQLIVTLEAAARTTEAHRVLPDAAGWLRSVAVTLRKRWPDADVDVASLGRYATRE